MPPRFLGPSCSALAPRVTLQSLTLAYFLPAHSARLIIGGRGRPQGSARLFVQTANCQGIT